MSDQPWGHLNNKALVWLVGTPEAVRVRDDLPDKIVYCGSALELPLIEAKEHRGGVRHLNKSVPCIPPGFYFVVIDPNNNEDLRYELGALQGTHVLTHVGHPWCPKGIVYISHHHQLKLVGSSFSAATSGAFSTTAASAGGSSTVGDSSTAGGGSSTAGGGSSTAVSSGS
jgi:hypothetical protein